MKVLLIGDGQLGHMLGRSAIQQGHYCLLYSTRTHQVMPLASSKPLALSLAEAVAWADVVSWEHEDVPADIIELARSKFLMDPEKITALTDRRSEKQLFDDCQVPTSPWQAFENKDELAQVLQQSTQPLVLKAARGGYDGKGQWRWQPQENADELLATAGQQAGIAENLIPFDYEVSLVGARDQQGTIRCYPLITNVHDRGILSYSMAGEGWVSEHLQTQAESYFASITAALDYVGVLAIEFFVVTEANEPRLLVNEIAPRVHNSGHWSMSGSNCDQFGLHMRCLTGLPLPDLLCAPTLMVNIIGVSAIPYELWQAAAADCHWYNKEARPGRKLGHVNFIIDTPERGRKLAEFWAPRLQQLAE